MIIALLRIGYTVTFLLVLDDNLAEVWD